jgi:hypothetical protein
MLEVRIYIESVVYVDEVSLWRMTCRYGTLYRSLGPIGRYRETGYLWRGPGFYVLKRRFQMFGCDYMINVSAFGDLSGYSICGCL